MSKKEDPSLAEALYGKEDKSPEKPDLSALKPFWDTSDKPEAESDKPKTPSLTEALYGNSTQRMENTLGRTLDQNISNLRNHFALTADQAAAMRTQHVHWFTDLVFGRDATAVHTLLTGRTLSPLTEEEQRDLTAKTMEQARGLYGEDTDRLIAKAKALIDSKPGLGDAIAAAGIGNHPAFVLPVLERVRG